MSSSWKMGKNEQGLSFYDRHKEKTLGFMHNYTYACLFCRHRHRLTISLVLFWILNLGLYIYLGKLPFSHFLQSKIHSSSFWEHKLRLSKYLQQRSASGEYSFKSPPPDVIAGCRKDLQGVRISPKPLTKKPSYYTWAFFFVHRKNVIDPEDPRCARLTLTGQMVTVPPEEVEFAKQAMFSRSVCNRHVVECNPQVWDKYTDVAVWYGKSEK